MPEVAYTVHGAPTGRTPMLPTLILVGADEERFLAAAHAMAQRIPGAREHVIDGAGHAANMDQPAEFNRLVLEFLEDV